MGLIFKIGDIVEVNAIEKFFCKNRKDALKIGSVKSSMGHGEACAGLCSLVKMIISFETGLIPPNINLRKLNPKIPAFYNGKVEVVTEATPCRGEFFAVNSFGIGGANGHILLSPNIKKKCNQNFNESEVPHLVLLSGRTEEAVNVLTTDMKKHYSDLEYIYLMGKVFSNIIDGHFFRGYFLKLKDKEPIQCIQKLSEEKRPLWFVFTGMGCQWPAMGKDLLKIPIFAESIRKSHKILECKGLDLMEIITKEDSHMFDNVLHAFVGIAAIQMALLEVLNALEIVPDGIIGHSAGEVICGYADGILTAEQTLLTAYYRGMIGITDDVGKGVMAVIGLQYDELCNSLPPEIDIACHNTKNNYTISGPEDIVNKFVENIKSKDGWARGVNTSGMAYHSRYVSPAAPKLLSNLKKVIANPKPRSKKWICTSALESQWETEKIKYASAEYYTNNLLSPVYFEQGAKNIPNNALVIEIAPHGLLQAILKQSLPPSVENISLASKNHDDNLIFFLNAIGKAYVTGINPRVENIYPPIEFPVSRGTPMIAPLVRWQHDEDWYVPRESEVTNELGKHTFKIDVKSADSKYLKGHIVDSRNIFPGMSYMNLIWESMATIQGKSKHETAVVFEDVHFLRATYILDKEIELRTSIQLDSGNFEITDNDAVVVKGRVAILEDTNEGSTSIYDWDTFPKDDLPMKSKDIYKALRLKGFQYQGLFRSLLSANIEGTFGKLKWDNNFDTFMDCLQHLKILTLDTSELILPTYVQKAIIDPRKHFQILHTLHGENKELLACHDKDLSALESGGVQMYGVKFTAISRRKDTKDVVLENYQFVPNLNNERSDLKTVIRLCTHIIIENLQVVKVKSVEIPNKVTETDELISGHILNALSDLPLILGDISILMENKSDIKLENTDNIKLLKGNLPMDKNLSLIIVSDILSKKDNFSQYFDALKENGFIIAREQEFDENSFKNTDLEVCFYRDVGDEKIVLLRKKQGSNITLPPIIIKLINFSYSWMPEVLNAVDQIDTKTNQKIVLYAEKETYSGILGFFNCIRKEFNNDILRCFFVMDENAPEFSLKNSLYESQFHKNLSHNVYKDGVWGSYRHMLHKLPDAKKCMHAFAKTAVRGDLSTLKWFEGPIDLNKYNEEKSLIHVYYAALNFRDIVLATGKVSVLDIYQSRIEEEKTMGFEVTGKNEKGERLMGITLEGNAISSLAYMDPLTLWKVPDTMTLEEAASIPTTYATAVLALFVHGEIRKGQSALIHAGCGEVGLACLHICTYYKCNIFTTVGTQEEREYIKKTFPQISENHIGYSQNTSFEIMVLKHTRGKGVDLLVNSLSEDKFHASLRCTAERGKFLEIGKYDRSKHTLIESYNFMKAIRFQCVMLDYLANASIDERSSFRDQVQWLIDSGVVKPLQRTVFDPEDLESAFRYMAEGKHIGKVVIKIRNEENDMKFKPQTVYINTYPRVMCNKIEVHIIIGGLGGFGLELTDWLVLRGARIIILNSRNGIKNGYQSFKVQQWKLYGVNIIIDKNDITTEAGVTSLLELANSLGPVAGIFNLAVLLRDNPFVQQTTESFLESAGPKAMATIHLDRSSRIMCPDLQYFVVFSSVSCGRGNLGQTNYGMYNSVMERVCESRRKDNLPGLAIQWGAVGDVGIVADMAEENKSVSIGGTLQQSINSCLETLNLFMKQEYPVVSSMIVAEKFRSNSNMVDLAANVLGIKDFKGISMNWTLPQLGMDSMMATELQQILKSELEISFTQKDLKNLTFNKLIVLSENNKRRHSVDGDEEIMKTVPNKFKEDELMLPIIRIPSLMDNGSTKEVDPQNLHTIFVFPGREGLPKAMEPLGLNINSQLLCLQYFFGAPYKDISAMANKFLPHIISRLFSSKQFQIIAYSLGCNLALEVTKLLEQQGYLGKIWFIDGAPLYNREIFSEYFLNRSLTESETQTRILIAFLKALSVDTVHEEILIELNERSTWDAKIEFVYPIISNFVKDKTIIEFVLNYLCCQITLSKCDILFKQLLKSKAALIRCSENKYNTPEDYGLSKYFETSVQIYKLETDHSSIVKDKKTAEIIMKDMM